MISEAYVTVAKKKGKEFLLIRLVYW